MKKYFLIFALLFSCPVLADVQLSMEGYGPIKFGAPLTEIENLLAMKAMTDLPEGANPNDADYQSCHYVFFKIYPGVAFMVEKNIVTRADIAKDNLTGLNVAVGDSLESVKRKFPNVRIEQHFYVDNGHYLILDSADKKRAILFEEWDGEVKGARAGLQPSVGYVEGCL